VKKLTLTAEPEVIDMAKKLAHARGTSVSAMFSQLIRAMANHHPRASDKIGPVTRRLTGIAKAPRGKNNRQLIEDAILQRYAS
jgi:hypothetical protein